jgi:sigma-B regulation protein RsbU (phosphoserine phosphatase)
VLLVDDQAIVAEAVRRMVSSESDIELHYCQDPTQAIRMAVDVNPTVILQDLVMPEIDGLTLVRFFRANEKIRDIPLIVLSSKEEPVIKAKAFELGANDYLVKLPDRIELIARIRHHSKGYINLLERNEVMRRLAVELAEAAEYVRRLLPEPMKESGLQTDWRFVPSTSLGGDTFGYHWLDKDHFVIYLLDVCGHGVGAALLSVSVMNVLRSQTLPNTDFKKPDQVLSALNEAFQMENHNDMYFTIWYGVYNKSTRQLVYSSGGHPPALMIDYGGGGEPRVSDLGTPNTIIGCMSGLTYTCDTAQLTDTCRLYIFSDGVYEVSENIDGKMWDVKDFVELMVKPQDGDQSKLDRLLQFVTGMHGSPSLEDDFSIVEVGFD